MVQPRPLDGLRVVVVDDFDDTRDAMQAYLSMLGARVRAAANGLEAWVMLRTERPDVVVLDLAMPEVDGFEVLSRMAQTESLRDVPVIVASGVAADDPRVRAWRARLGAFLPKPVDPDRLVAAILAAAPQR